MSVTSVRDIDHPDFENASSFPLQKLRQLAREATCVQEFVAELKSVTTELLGARSVRVWQANDVGNLVEIENTIHLDDVNGSRREEPPSLEVMTSAMAQRTVRIVSTVKTSASDSESDEECLPTFWMLGPVVGSIAVYGVVVCEFSVEEEITSNPAIVNRMQSILDVSSPFFESRYIRDLIGDKDFDLQFHDFCRELHTDPSMSVTPGTIATEFQRLFHCDRTWILMPHGRRWRVKAAGSIPGFQRRSAVIRKLEQLVRLFARTKQPFRWSVGESTSNLLPRVVNAFDQYLDEVHVVSLRVEPLFQPDSQEAADTELPRSKLIGVVVCEWFQPAQRHFEENRWKAARQQAGIAIQNASDWHSAPVSGFLRHWRRRRSWQFLAGWGAAIAIGSTVAVFAALMPIEFTIEAMGELQPVRQRHVFATSNGIVRELAVSSGAEVVEGATLLELDSPELELEMRRVDGELQTTGKRIAAIEASRLDFGSSSSDSGSQINTLAGELKEQKQRQENLRRELDLLSHRREELKVTSPIQGRVVTWDLERLLSRRPVTRGQRLLTISDTSGPWELELRVNDEDTSDLYAVMRANESVSLDFVAITMPERIHSTKLKSISETIEIRSPGEPPSLLCRADMPESLLGSAVEGMSVRGRIQCGRRIAIGVVFTKVWRAVRERILFPWGW